MNFMEGVGKNVNLDEIKITVAGMDLIFTPVSGSISLRDDQSIVLGIRPEFLKISEMETGKARIYSTLPSGMETVVKVKIGDQLLTSVVFGAIDYELDKAVGIEFCGDNCVVFDKETGTNLALGRLTII
jgi:multiple sugar transport system ATP-binding protein